MIIIGRRILAEIIPNETKVGSIHVPENVNLDNDRAEIVIIGDRVKHYKVGDIVKFNKNSAVFMEVRKTDCVFLREDQDILGID